MMGHGDESALASSRPLDGRRRSADRVYAAVESAGGGVLVFALLLVFVAIGRLAWPSLMTLGLRPLITTTWDPSRNSFGMLAFVWGTATTSLLAMLLAVPVGLGVGLFMTDLGPRRASSLVASGLELLAAVPSVVFGLWAFHGLVPWMRDAIPSLSSEAVENRTGVGPLTAALVLSIMILPSFSRLTKDVLSAVPIALREGAIALGGTPWEVVRYVVLPHAFRGIVGASLLALGRVLGEAVAVAAVIGGKAEISSSLLTPSYTLATVLAKEFAGAVSSMHVAAIAELGGLLLLVTMAFNIAARVLVMPRRRAEDRP
jgi:phosphate transport system permease protein